MQTNKQDLLDTHSGYQKSAFMEEFEEVLPSSELSDYINLQKEIKRLSEENFHLSTENKELLSKLKHYRQHDEEKDTSLQVSDEFAYKQQEYEMKLSKFEQEIFVCLDFCFSLKPFDYVHSRFIWLFVCLFKSHFAIACKPIKTATKTK